MLQETININQDITSLSPQQLAVTKVAFTTRRVNTTAIKTLIHGNLQPRPGDLVLARVEKIGHHKHIELTDGRRASLFVGDEIVVSYGYRYAPDQFESKVPRDLSPCHLVAAGGIASLCLSQHANVREPTRIQPLGLLGDGDGSIINLTDWTLPQPPDIGDPCPLIIAVAGTTMNAGKTTSAAGVVKGLTRGGMKVAGAKLTGTGSGGDRWSMLDAGATEVVDFTDAGFASTSHLPLPRLEQIQRLLVDYLSSRGVDAIVLEIADGLYQRETAMLLSSHHFRSTVTAMIFAASDAMGAGAGTEWLFQRDLPLVALSGRISVSPLASREAAQITGLPVVGPEDLADPDQIAYLFGQDNDPAERLVERG